MPPTVCIGGNPLGCDGRQHCLHMAPAQVVVVHTSILALLLPKDRLCNAAIIQVKG